MRLIHVNTTNISEPYDDAPGSVLEAGEKKREETKLIEKKKGKKRKRKEIIATPLSLSLFSDLIYW